MQKYWIRSPISGKGIMLRKIARFICVIIIMGQMNNYVHANCCLG
jgi:hypothetical protein